MRAQNHPPPPHKKPLNLDVQWYRDLNDFKGWFFYDIFQHQYNVSFDKKADCDCLLGVHHRTLEELYQALTNPKKRLVFMGENERIDFNVYDFAMSFDHLEFGDRYLRVPLYYQSLHWFLHIITHASNPPFRLDGAHEMLHSPLTLHLPLNSTCTKISFADKYPHLDALAREQKNPLEREFASFVASNWGAPMRNNFYQQLNEYRPVAGGGRVFNTIGKPVSNKHDFLAQYKFNLCFENSLGIGYTTEKITDAYFAHTVPIYWGNPLVHLDFNPKSFVNVHDFANLDEAIDFVRYLDTHDNAYLDMLHAHPLSIVEGKPKFCHGLSFKKILDFLVNAIESPHNYHEQVRVLSNSVYKYRHPSRDTVLEACSGREHLQLLLKKLHKKLWKRKRP
ncbi:glycosyltransferase family 10 domain-containing protein [Helicobacter felis]|uniref:glycosyltransferase family 10 domain-containing protein n=1 Tax=Helicobacter felis TaxID=214 RepID=UPI00131548C1|nr:glycosyltransferase family 10 [Helicobacter felis]